MAEIYRIGSDDLVDRVSTFGGTNLAKGTDYTMFNTDTYYYKTNVTFLDNNTAKIEAGGRLSRSTTQQEKFRLTQPIIFDQNNKTIVTSFYVYENTLNQNCICKLWYYHSTNGAGGAYTIVTVPAQETGFFKGTYDFAATIKDHYGYFLDIQTTDATSGYIIIGPVKIEKGNKPTDWTPSQYDLVTYDSSSESLVFFQ